MPKTAPKDEKKVEDGKIAVLTNFSPEEIERLQKKTKSDIRSQMVLIAVRSYINQD